MFPFSKLHPNAGPRLFAEFSLIPPSLYSAGGELVFDSMSNVSIATKAPFDKAPSS
jgi:hypothetical protein